MNSVMEHRKFPFPTGRPSPSKPVMKNLTSSFNTMIRTPNKRSSEQSINFNSPCRNANPTLTKTAPGLSLSAKKPAVQPFAIANMNCSPRSNFVNNTRHFTATTSSLTVKPSPPRGPNSQAQRSTATSSADSRQFMDYQSLTRMNYMMFGSAFPWSLNSMILPLPGPPRNQRPQIVNAKSKHGKQTGSQLLVTDRPPNSPANSISSVSTKQSTCSLVGSPVPSDEELCATDIKVNRQSKKHTPKKKSSTNVKRSRATPPSQQSIKKIRIPKPEVEEPFYFGDELIADIYIPSFIFPEDEEEIGTGPTLNQISEEHAPFKCEDKDPFLFVPSAKCRLKPRPSQPSDDDQVLLTLPIDYPDDENDSVVDIANNDLIIISETQDPLQDTLITATTPLIDDADDFDSVFREYIIDPVE